MAPPVFTLPSIDLDVLVRLVDWLSGSISGLGDAWSWHDQAKDLLVPLAFLSLVEHLLIAGFLQPVASTMRRAHFASSAKED